MWVQSTLSLNSKRYYSAATQLKDGYLFVSGGAYGGATNRTEMLTERGWEVQPSLPVPAWGHCMVTVNKTTIMAIAGQSDNHITINTTFYFTFGQESWTMGPALAFKRYYKDCLQK